MEGFSNYERPFFQVLRDAGLYNCSLYQAVLIQIRIKNLIYPIGIGVTSRDNVKMLHPNIKINNCFVFQLHRSRKQIANFDDCVPNDYM